MEEIPLPPSEPGIIRHDGGELRLRKPALVAVEAMLAIETVHLAAADFPWVILRNFLFNPSKSPPNASVNNFFRRSGVMATPTFSWLYASRYFSMSLRLNLYK